MRIGIDARLWGTKHRGIGRYTAALLKELELIDDNNEYFIFLDDDGMKNYQPQRANFKKVRANFRVYSLAEQLFFPYLLLKYRLKVVHFTHFNVPLLFWDNFIVTIHDLIISHYPDQRATTLNPFWYKLKLFLYNLVIAHSVNKAKKINHELLINVYKKKTKKQNVN